MLNGVGIVWEFHRVLDEMTEKPKVLALEMSPACWFLTTERNYRNLHQALRERAYKCGAIFLNSENFPSAITAKVFVIAIHNDVQIPRGNYCDGANWLT
jgi:DNA (cytosine-5)-methyltransferase 1